MSNRADVPMTSMPITGHEDGLISINDPGKEAYITINPSSSVKKLISTGSSVGGSGSATSNTGAKEPLGGASGAGYGGGSGTGGGGWSGGGSGRRDTTKSTTHTSSSGTPKASDRVAPPPKTTPEAPKPVSHGDNYMVGLPADYRGPTGNGSAPTDNIEYNGGNNGNNGGNTPASDGSNPTVTPSDTPAAEPAKTQEQLLAEQWAEAGEVTKRLVEGATPEEIGIDRLQHVDTAELENMLQQIKAAQEQQTAGQIDYNVQRGTDELNRAVEDAANMYQTERNQIAADEMRALDNQALYAETRGDRGGIGAAQYASIQNNAAANQYKVNQEQTKLATDTARQVADLRAQGEFEKADALLDITQSYLSELMNLKQYALNANMSVDEFNAKLAQWEAEYDLSARQYMSNLEMSAANLTGAFADGTPTLSAQNRLREQLANAGAAMVELGLEPTDAQLEAMGWTKEQYTAYKAEQDLQKAAAAASRNYSGGSSGMYTYNGQTYTTAEIQYLQSIVGLPQDGVPTAELWALLAAEDGGIDAAEVEAELVNQPNNEAQIQSAGNANTNKETIWQRLGRWGKEIYVAPKDSIMR